MAGKPVDVFEPASAPRFALVYLHGHGLCSLAEKPVAAALLEKHLFACVAPRGDISWWSDRIWPPFDPGISAERFIVERLRPAILDRWQLGPRGVGLFGVSMGGQGALRIGFRHPDDFPVVAGISSAIDYHDHYGDDEFPSIAQLYDSKEQCRQDTALMHIHPAHQPPHVFFCCDPDDSWWRGNDRLHEKLTALGVVHECDLDTRAGGHDWSYFTHVMPRTLAFMHAGLEIQSRRLL
ncbi:MAG: alpha/beta hydrolase-fold protein [Gemmataceae bacterium]